MSFCFLKLRRCPLWLSMARQRFSFTCPMRGAPSAVAVDPPRNAKGYSAMSLFLFFRLRVLRVVEFIGPSLSGLGGRPPAAAPRSRRCLSRCMNFILVLRRLAQSSTFWAWERGMAPSQAKQLAGLFVAVIIFFVLLVVVRASLNNAHNGHVCIPGRARVS